MALTQEQKDGVVKGLVGGLKDLVIGSPGVFLDRPGFIQGGGGSDPLSNAVRAVSRFNCRQWAASNKDDYSTNVNQGNSALCNPYLTDIGELPPEGDVAAPFTGGQCSVSYRPTGTYVQGNKNGPGYGSTRAWRIGGNITGPIVGIVSAGTPVGTSWAFLSASGGGLPFRNILDNATGQVLRGPNPIGVSTDLQAVQRPSIGSVGIVSGSDTCGSPPTALIPPGTSTPVGGLPPNITVNIPGIGPTSITVELKPDGNPTICVPEVEVCFDLDIGGDSPGGGGADPGTPEVGTPGSTGDGGDEEGDAPEGRELWALKIDINSFPTRPNEYAPGVYRGVCYVYMGDDNGLDHDTAGAMMRDGQLVLAEKEGLTKYRVTANLGYNLTVTPYWRTPRKES